MRGAKIVPYPIRRCPICKKASIDAWKPFCSKRCADVDLGRWLGETYRIPAHEDPDDQDVFDDDE